MSGGEEVPNVTDRLHEQPVSGEARLHGHRRPPVSMDQAHVEELERENVRLQLLVAELLMKNQQLRKAD